MQNIDTTMLNLKEKYFLSHGIIKVSETKLGSQSSNAYL